MNRAKHLIGAIFLISGTTIGAAILALPVVTGLSGFSVSVALMVACWFYLLIAALYLVEVNLAFASKEVNLLTMAERTLGLFGTVLCWSAYLFLLYALNTAYMFITLELFQNAIQSSIGQPIARIFCVIPLLALFLLLLRSGTNAIDTVNRIAMITLLCCFVLLIGLALPHVHIAYLTEVHSERILPALAIVLTAFGYHVVIPTVVHYLHGSVSAIKKAIWIGSFLPLAMYIAWQVTVLGVVPMYGTLSITSALADNTNGAAILAAVCESGAVKTISHLFAFFAVITSFFGVSLSLFDFLADALHIHKHAAGKWKLFFFAFIPPLYFSLSEPDLFLKALHYAGVFGVVVLLALLPALMVFRKRYVLHLRSSYTVPGGKTGLLLFIVLSIGLIIILF